MTQVSAQTANFNRLVLGQLGAPTSGNSLGVLDTMAAQESSGYLTGVNNPEATTRSGTGGYNLPGSAFSSGRNSAGVKGYGSQSQGVAATAATFQQGNFSAILALLKSGAPASAYTTGAAAQELRLWQGGSSADVNALRGGTAKVGGSTGQTSGATSAQNSAFNPSGWLGALGTGTGAILGAPATIAGWLGGVVGTGVGAAAGATAAATVSAGSGAALGAAEGFYAAAKPFVVPIAVAFVVAMVLTPELMRGGKPLTVAISEALPAPAAAPAPAADTPAPALAAPAIAAPPDDSETPMTPGQVIQDQVGKGVRNNAVIFREIQRRKAAGTLLEDAPLAAAA